MAKEKKTSEELKALLDESIKRDENRREGAQWNKIIRIDPPVEGCNWTVSHSGESGGYADAIDRAQATLKRLYDLA
jgi:hypothetical protein